MTEEQWDYWISPNALSLMIEESRAIYPRETGGILVGWQDGSIFHIKIAVGPGPKALHRQNRFSRDGDYSQSKLDQIVDETQGELDYLGEWHSHPRKMGPSSKDLHSLRKIKTDTAYNISDPILGLVVYEQTVWRFFCYMLKNDHELVKIRQIVCE